MAAIVGSVFFVVNFAVAVFGAPKKTATNLPVFTLVWVVCERVLAQFNNADRTDGHYRLKSVFLIGSDTRWRPRHSLTLSDSFPLSADFRASKYVAFMHSVLLQTTAHTHTLAWCDRW